MSTLKGTPAQLHGLAGDPNWTPASVILTSDMLARSGLAANEIRDTDEVLEQKAELLIDLLRNSQNCVVYTGKGISTAAGSKDASSAPNSTVMANQVRGGAMSLNPTRAHRVIAQLHEQGLVKNWVQQCQDGLAQKAGFPQRDINEIHGSWFDPSNPEVPLEGTLRASNRKQVEDLIKRTDLVLAIGTSLGGSWADQIVSATAAKFGATQQGGSVIISIQQTTHDANSTLRVFSGINQFFAIIERKLNLVLNPYNAGPDLSLLPRTDVDHVYPNLSYDRTGKFDLDALMTLDLRPGATVRIVDQPKWDQAEHGETAFVKQCVEPHKYYDLEMVKSGKRRRLGPWWLTAAYGKSITHLPIVNQ
eukprot:c53013_g1_i1.p1 GENE.c53013_g1_i1~~c53013_g1_i1.p1  ORF type:complete len:362 (-),score=71.56 c53013_g1_i1:17-1102(-)